MINTLYKYDPLTRVEVNGVRHYSALGGKPLPSVTTILGAMKDKTALLEWRAAVGDAEANRITTQATNIGTKIHQHLENHILSVDRPGGTNFLHVKAKELADIVIEKGMSNVSEVWGTEVPLYYPDLYAGTTDCVGLWKNKPAIIDFKSTRKAKKREWIEDYFMQGAAYATAHNEVHGTEIRTIVIMMIGWDEGNYGNYQEFVIEGSDFDHYGVEWAKKVGAYYDKYM